MRGHDEFQRVAFDRVAAAATPGDDMGMNRMYQALRLLFLNG